MTTSSMPELKIGPCHYCGIDTAGYCGGWWMCHPCAAGPYLEDGTVIPYTGPPGSPPHPRAADRMAEGSRP